MKWWWLLNYLLKVTQFQRKWRKNSWLPIFQNQYKHCNFILGAFYSVLLSGFSYVCAQWSILADCMHDKHLSPWIVYLALGHTLAIIYHTGIFWLTKLLKKLWHLWPDFFFLSFWPFLQSFLSLCLGIPILLNPRLGIFFTNLFSRE